jgi:8-oxo-dGTP pyrophosphatase MutT (NUDIX family)
MHGNYNTHVDREILALLDEMTVDEKLILLSLDFQIVWYFWWMNNEFHMQSFFHMKNKYISITNDNGKRLKRLIQKSKNGSRIWEIPKGRRNQRESEIQCAIRELEEESGMKKDDFRLLAIPPTKVSHVDNEVMYTSKYFIADCISSENIGISYDIETMGEISEIKWMAIEDIRVIDQFNRLAPLCKGIMDKYKKYNKITSVNY